MKKIGVTGNHLLFLFSLLSGTALYAASINFGSKTSTIMVKHGSIMEIAPTRDVMEIDGGNFMNQGFGTIFGKPLQFKRGVYTFFNSVSDLNGTLLPEGNIIQLLDDGLGDGGGTMIANPGGLSQVRVYNYEGINLMRGQPLFFGENDLQLAGQSTVLRVAVQNAVNTNITLNGGILTLQDNLHLGDDAVILDDGHVIFNKRRMTLGGKASVWAGEILWENAEDLQLNSAVTLNGKWTFQGNGQINGNGNVIDLANGGSIIVSNNSQLRLSGLHIKGLGEAGKIKLAPAATLILSDVVIEMESDYTIDSGTVFIEGNSTVITKNYILTFGDSVENSTSGKLIVDRVALTYDTLASIDQLNIRPPLIQDPTRKYVEIFGQGEIRTIRSDTITFHNYRSEPVLQKYAIVAPYRKFEVFPEILEGIGEVGYDVIIDGNTNFLGFTKTDEKVFIITPGVHATTQNIILRDFSTKHVQFDAGSSLVFGDQTTITFARNEYLDYPWYFQGTTVLRGAGNILELGPNGSIIIQGENSQLLLDSLIIKGVNGTNIRCVSDSSKLQLKNVKWVQSGNVTYNNGGIELLDEVTMLGGFVTVDSVQQPFNFIYNSSQPFRILSDGTLLLTRNMIFTYSPVSAASNLMQFEDYSGAIWFDQATLAAASGTNLQLTGGRVVVRGRNFLSGSISIATDVLVDRPSGSTLEQV